MLLVLSPAFPLVNFCLQSEIPLGNLPFLSICPLVNLPFVLEIPLTFVLEEAVSTLGNLLEDSPLISVKRTK